MKLTKYLEEKEEEEEGTVLMELEMELCNVKVLGHKDD